MGSCSDGEENLVSSNFKEVKNSGIFSKTKNCILNEWYMEERFMFTCECRLPSPSRASEPSIRRNFWQRQSHPCVFF